MGEGACVGLCGLAAGYAIGEVGSAGVLVTESFMTEVITNSFL